MRRTARSSTHQSAREALYGVLELKESLNFSDWPEPPKSEWFMLLVICSLQKFNFSIVWPRKQHGDAQVKLIEKNPATLTKWFSWWGLYGDLKAQVFEVIKSSRTPSIVARWFRVCKILPACFGCCCFNASAYYQKVFGKREKTLAVMEHSNRVS